MLMTLCSLTVVGSEAFWSRRVLGFRKRRQSGDPNGGCDPVGPSDPADWESPRGVQYGRRRSHPPSAQAGGGISFNDPSREAGKEA
ncbi:hypothetical protein GCM10028783_24460 [Modestobacter muralis]